MSDIGLQDDKNGHRDSNIDFQSTLDDTRIKEVENKEETNYASSTTAGTFMMKNALRNAKNKKTNKDKGADDLTSKLNKEIDMLSKQVGY